MEEEHIRKWKNERQKLESFLSERGVNASKLNGELNQLEFSAFIGALADMGRFIEKGIDASKSGDLELTGHILGEAKIQKDRVYLHLIKTYGVENPFEIRMEGYTKVLRDYVMKRYEEGVNKCIQILEEVA